MIMKGRMSRAVSAAVLMAFIHECCPDLSFSSAIRANLFKCGNKTVHRHYISWKRVNTAQPNFHVTEAFGTMSFEQ